MENVAGLGTQKLALKAFYYEKLFMKRAVARGQECYVLS